MKPENVRLAIFGMGYVGCVSAASLSSRGSKIIGIDKNTAKVDQIRTGLSPIVEPMVQELVSSGVETGRLTATADAGTAIRNTDAAFVCVGTPSAENGQLNTTALEQVTVEIASALKTDPKPYYLIYRSTVEPGTVEEKLLPAITRIMGPDWGRFLKIGYHPEFMREGCAVKDFFDPSKTVIGTEHTEVAEWIKALYQGSTGPFFKTSIKTAETIKLVDNTFHALKVAFGNEIGAFCHSLGLDAHELMHLFTSDTKLNISPKYLIPGQPFGGSCLPKDLRSMGRYSAQQNVSMPVVNHILASNRDRSREIVKRIMKHGKKAVGFLGLSFKPHTDDLRESPTVNWVETLLGKGYDLKIYDPQINLARIIGENKKFMDTHLPHIMDLLTDSAEEMAENCEMIVITQAHDEFVPLFRQMKQRVLVLDLAGLKEIAGIPHIVYEGLYW